MNPPVPAAVPSGLPDPERHLRLARLENKITELAAHINAATFQLLQGQGDDEGGDPEE